MQQVTYAGVVFRLGAASYVVPGLSLKQMRANKDTMVRFIEIDNAKKAGQEFDAFEALDLAAKLITVAVQRNYPEVPEDLIAEAVDMNSFPPIMSAIMGGSGLKLVTEVPSDGGAPGEG